MTATKKSTSTTTSQTSDRFTAEERAAIKERAKELKAETRSLADKADGLRAVLAKIAEMKGSDRTMAEQIHKVVTASAPGLTPKLWYGMPSYATDGKIVCFFQAADKFKSRYATLGFNEDANLDEGNMWPTSWALTKLTAADEARIAELVKKAVH